MEPTIYKPSIYKGAGIYKTGAGGGGGGEMVEIGGIKYNIISIGSQKWLDRNLYFTWSGLTINPNTQTNTAYGAFKDLDFQYSVGMAYNKAAINYLVNHTELLNGFKVPSEQDFEDLISFVGDSNALCNDIWGGNDDYGFNLKPSGIFYSNNNNWLRQSVAQLATSHYDSDFLHLKDFAPQSYYSFESITNANAACVRLIKA